MDELAPHHVTTAKGLVGGGANVAIGLIVASAPSSESVVGGLVIGALGYGLSITLWWRAHATSARLAPSSSSPSPRSSALPSPAARP